jgi:hypothetical protein
MADFGLGRSAYGMRVQWLRDERVFASFDGLFRSVPSIQRAGNAGRLGWRGLVRRVGDAV